MKIQIWGCRGSVAIPGNRAQYLAKLQGIFDLLQPSDLISEEAKQEFIDRLPFFLKDSYGGETACVEIRDEENQVLIVDTGTGARRLGRNLLRDFPFDIPKEYHIMYSHTHWDHINGLMFFEPIYSPKNTFHFWSLYEDLKKRLDTQQDSAFFPVPLADMGSKKIFHTFEVQKTYTIHGFSVETFFLRHPGGCLGFRISQSGHSWLYLSDTEYDVAEEGGADRYVNFLRGADIVLFDTQYEVWQMEERRNWGHSNGMIAVDICNKAQVLKMVMFHHDPWASDEILDFRLDQLNDYQTLNYPESKMKIIAGYDGLVLDI